MFTTCNERDLVVWLSNNKHACIFVIYVESTCSGIIKSVLSIWKAKCVPLVYYEAKKKETLVEIDNTPVHNWGGGEGQWAGQWAPLQGPKVMAN